MLKWLIRGLAIMIVSFGFGFFYSYSIPQIKAFVLMKLEDYSEAHLPVFLTAQDVDLSFQPLGLAFSKVRIIPREPLNEILAPMTIKRVGLSLSLFGLIEGEFRLSQLRLDEPHVRAIIKKSKNQDATTKFQLQMLFDVPIEELIVTNMNAIIKAEPLEAIARTSGFDFSLVNKFDALLVDLESRDVEIKPLGGGNTLNFEWETRALIEENQVQLSALKLLRQESILVA